MLAALALAWKLALILVPPAIVYLRKALGSDAHWAEVLRLAEQAWAYVEVWKSHQASKVTPEQALAAFMSEIQAWAQKRGITLTEAQRGALREFARLRSGAAKLGR